MKDWVIFFGVILLSIFSFPSFAEEAEKVNSIIKNSETSTDKDKESSCKKDSDKDKESTADKKEEKKSESTEVKDADKDPKEPEKKEDNFNPADVMMKFGNLSFPTSQQPSPLVSLGQNVLSKKQLEIEAITLYFEREHEEYSIGIIPTLIYGFTDEISGLISFPIIVRDRVGDYHSSGGGDIVFQLEYAPFTFYTPTYYDQLTLIGNVTIPTGSRKKTPQLGIGANSFLLGGTFSRMGIDWFWFVSGGGLIVGSSHGIEHGDIALYQFGFGRRIWNSNEWLIAWQVEFDGSYTWRDRIHEVYDPNSGGSLFLATPSLLISSEHLTLQLGVGVPIQQHFFGIQNRVKYTLDMNLAWSF